MKFKLFSNKPSCEIILNKRYNFDRFSDFLKSLSNKELHKLGEKIINKKYDGYNFKSCYSETIYFDNLSRWQKEIYIEQRNYLLYN